MLDPTIVVAAITTAGTVAGIIATRKVGTGSERRKEKQSLQAQARLFEDAANKARQMLRDAGLPVPPWPKELTKMNEGGDDE